MDNIVELSNAVEYWKEHIPEVMDAGNVFWFSKFIFKKQGRIPQEPKSKYAIIFEKNEAGVCLGLFTSKNRIPGNKPEDGFVRFETQMGDKKIYRYGVVLSPETSNLYEKKSPFKKETGTFLFDQCVQFYSWSEIRNMIEQRCFIQKLGRPNDLFLGIIDNFVDECVKAAERGRNGDEKEYRFGPRIIDMLKRFQHIREEQVPDRGPRPLTEREKDRLSSIGVTAKVMREFSEKGEITLDGFFSSPVHAGVVPQLVRAQLKLSLKKDGIFVVSPDGRTEEPLGSAMREQGKMERMSAKSPGSKELVVPEKKEIANSPQNKQGHSPGLH